MNKGTRSRMIFIPVTREHYLCATLEVEDDCRDGMRVLAWVNYIVEIGIKRYYISEKYRGEWHFVSVDVFPEDRDMYWDFYTRDAYERDIYIDSIYMYYDE